MPFTLFLAARVVSIFGSQVSLVAIPWLVITSSGSATKMGVVAALEMAVMSLAAIPAGVVIDRVGPRRYLLVSDLALAVLTVTLCLCAGKGVLSFPLLLLITALVTIPTAGYGSAASVAMRGIVGSSPSALAKAGAENSLAYQLGSIAGKALAGVIVAVLGAVHSLYVDAASFAISFLIFCVALPKSQGVPRQESSDREDSWRAGVSFLRHHTQLLRLVAGATLTAASFIGLGVALPAALARRGGAPSWFGFAMAGLTVGTIVGSAVCRRLSASRSAPALLSIAIRFKLLSAATIPSIALLPQAGNVPLFLLGVAAAFEGASVFGILGSEVPEGYLGRVLSAVGAAATVLTPLSALGIGMLLDATPLLMTAVILGVVAAVGALVQIDRRRHEIVG